MTFNLLAAITTPRPSPIQDPPIARFLLTDVRMAWVLLPLRLWLGWSWLTSGWGKITNPAWVDNGTALKSFWERALVTDPKPVIAIDWYRDFLQFLLNAEAYTWFAKLIAYGEILIAVALVLGAFTGIAAFFGGFLNWNFVMAGSASTNGLLFVVATWLVLAWKTAGWIGLDRYLLHALGTPGRPGHLVARYFTRQPTETQQFAAQQTR